MANESKTEAIVRKHFEKFSDIIVFEKQCDIVKIDKLLKNASKSKKGLGKGYPEFIITFDSNSDLIIVIECKSDIRKHESKNRDNYADYAVDGVLLYASFLSKEYDVIAIAVSGEKVTELKVTHFLHLKGETKAIEKFGNKLLSPENYYKSYIESPEKIRQDYYTLIEYSIKLNNRLEHEKILANQRGLFLSSVLIALKNKAFAKSYKDFDLPEDLANHLVDTVMLELKKSLPAKKVENLGIQFSFIRTDATLSAKRSTESGRNILTELIEDINENVNAFIQTYKYFDTLGQLYIEFLSYANNDSDLGIVLTPPHITDLFCDLAEIDKDSILLDNCTGTAGFLISGMRRMIIDAKDDETKIAHIKEHQLIGIEYQSHIYALAATNMFIHKDGKSNIIHGDCFKVIDDVKKHKPNKGMLNPPYPNDKKKGRNEFEFILNNLECLQSNGTCVAIIPMERVFSAKRTTLEFKKVLLENHTLEAVMSMPDDLFHNSDNGVVTAVLVITAHKPHPKNKETYFGYWKDDGFIKVKNKGRIDANDKWNDIKNKWVDSFINRKSIPGISVTKVVKAEDEWCAEAYMETDYSKLSKSNFERNIKEYVLFNELFIKYNE